MAVIAAFELHREIAAGEAAREADGRHGRLGAGVDQAHQLDRRHGVPDLFGQLDFPFGGRAEAGSDFESLLQSLQDGRVAVPQ